MSVRVLWSGPEWSDEAISFVSAQVTELLRQKFDVAIVVPRQTIVDVLQSQLEYFRPKTGDIFSRYTLQRKLDEASPLQLAIDVIVATISIEFEQDASNASFSIWNSVDGTLLGMQFHPQVRLNQRRPKQRFNMRF